MQITPLNSSISMLSKYYELNTTRINGKAYASIDETTGKNVNATGVTNPMTEQINPSLGLDVSAVYNAITNPSERLNILMLMTKPDLLNLLFMLDKEKLVLGLNFFSIPKLLQMINNFPKEMLIQALLMHMDQRTLLSILPQRELMRILGNHKINESMLLKAIQNLPTHILIQMLESILGQSVGKLKHADVMGRMKHLKKRQIMEGILTLPKGSLLEIALKFTQNDPSLLMSISRAGLTKPFSRMSKSMLVNSFMVMDSADIIKLMGGLPKNLIAQIACMIDPGDLADILSTQFQSLMASMM